MSEDGESKLTRIVRESMAGQIQGIKTLLSPPVTFTDEQKAMIAQRTPKGDPMNRDTQFAGFAEKLWQELSDEIDWIIQSKGDAERIIARRAYDFMVHVVGHSMEYLDECGREIPGSMTTRVAASIPDMTTWPEETSK